MTRRDDDPSERLGARSAIALSRIAEALGRPVETFLRQPSAQGDTESAQELLRLWSDLPDIHARHRVLSQLRFEVERHRSHSAAAE